MSLETTPWNGPLPIQQTSVPYDTSTLTYDQIGQYYDGYSPTAIGLETTVWTPQ